MICFMTSKNLHSKFCALIRKSSTLEFVESSRTMSSSSKPFSLPGFNDSNFLIMQAPMAGGPSTPALAAAVSEAGGLGSLAGGYSSPEQIRSQISEVRKLTKRPFAVNLFIFTSPPMPSDDELSHANTLLDSYREELSLARDHPLPTKFYESLDDQLNVILEEKPYAFSFTFGIPPAAFLKQCKARNIITIGTATNVNEAVALRDAGVDAICAQGYEAGGHRGTFIGKMEDSRIGLIALLQQIVAADLNIPVFAAGGIMDHRGIAACIAMGVARVSMGTAFLLCPEAGTSFPYRSALRDPQQACHTEITRLFSGRDARGIKNRFMTEMEQHGSKIPPYPIQNALTRELRTACAKAGKADFLSLWAGQGAPLIQEMPAGMLVLKLIRDTTEAIRR